MIVEEIEGHVRLSASVRDRAGGREKGEGAI